MVHYAALTDLEFALWTRLALNLELRESHRLYLPSAEFKGECHHAFFTISFMSCV